VKAPIYIFHGDIDYVIPFENSLKLKTNLKLKDKLFLLENQGHLGVNENDSFLFELKEILK
jgi:dipeptidyl aminopeptidase/acylaminoacyl peptidase